LGKYGKGFDPNGSVFVIFKSHQNINYAMTVRKVAQANRVFRYKKQQDLLEA
jgi:hypothetical protein